MTITRFMLHLTTVFDRIVICYDWGTGWSNLFTIVKLWINIFSDLEEVMFKSSSVAKPTSLKIKIEQEL